MMPYALRPRPLLRTRLALAGAALLLATPMMAPSFAAHAAEASATDTKPADAKPAEAAPAVAKTATIDQVYAAVRSGDVPGALAMMEPVLKAHPGSAKAHFVEAELLARAHRTAEARDELAKAESLAPGLSGIKPSAVTALRAQLNGGSSQAAMRSATPMVAPARSHVPWGAIIIIGLAILGFMALTRRRAAPPAYPQAYGPGAGGVPGGMMGGGAPGYGPGYGPAYGGMGGGMGGGGILGGLASGAAMGAGFAAGEEIVGHMFGGGHGERPIDGGAQGGWDQGGNPNAGMGGDDFGVSDGGSWDDGGGAGGGGGDGGGW